MQDLDPDVQRRVNRIQPAKLFEDILTERVRKVYKEIAFDLLIGQPGQTVNSMEKTCDGVIKLKPTLVQLSLMAYKPWVSKYQIRMVEEGPLPDFLERKELMDVIHKKYTLMKMLGIYLNICLIKQQSCLHLNRLVEQNNLLIWQKTMPLKGMPLVDKLVPIKLLNINLLICISLLH